MTEHPFLVYFVNVHIQNDGVVFIPVQESDWLPDGDGSEKEYIVVTSLFVEDDRQYNKCIDALDEENGIYFGYPGFKTGGRMVARIIKAEQIPGEGNLKGLRLWLVLDQNGYDDWKSIETKW